MVNIYIQYIYLIIYFDISILLKKLNKRDLLSFDFLVIFYTIETSAVSAQYAIILIVSINSELTKTVLFFKNNRKLKVNKVYLKVIHKLKKLNVECKK